MANLEITKCFGFQSPAKTNGSNNSGMQESTWTSSELEMQESTNESNNSGMQGMRFRNFCLKGLF